MLEDRFNNIAKKSFSRSPSLPPSKLYLKEGDEEEEEEAVLFRNLVFRWRFVIFVHAVIL